MVFKYRSKDYMFRNLMVYSCHLCFTLRHHLGYWYVLCDLFIDAFWEGRKERGRNVYIILTMLVWIGVPVVSWLILFKIRALHVETRAEMLQNPNLVHLRNSMLEKSNWKQFESIRKQYPYLSVMQPIPFQADITKIPTVQVNKRLHNILKLDNLMVWNSLHFCFVLFMYIWERENQNKTNWKQAWN